MLETDDIQHILLTRTPALTGRYEFLTFRSAAGGRAWLTAMLEKVQSAAAVQTSVESDKRWVTVAFTWNGLRALGVDEASLSTFPEEFRQGMVARAEVLGDTGANDPANWVGGLASPDLHAIVILFARDAAERERCRAEHEKLLAKCEGVEGLSSLDLEATPPFEYAHDHFGYRDRLSQPVIEGTGETPTPGLRRAAQGGRVHPRLPGRGRTLRSICRSPRSSRATAATWPTAAWRSTSARFATSCGRTARRPRNRSSSRRS